MADREALATWRRRIAADTELHAAADRWSRRRAMLALRDRITTGRAESDRRRAMLALRDRITAGRRPGTPTGDPPRDTAGGGTNATRPALAAPAGWRLVDLPTERGRW